MKIQALNDLHNELNRLFIAGSRFAKGDPRISKYIPLLTKMGEKAPVMKRLAEKVNILVTAEQNDAAEALVDVGAFLNSILATQGSSSLDLEETKIKGQLTKYPSTSNPYSQLRPVIEALTLVKPGRYEVIVNAHKAGQLDDFRLYEYIVAGLDDKYSELANYIQDKVIPDIDSVFIPYLLDTYDVKGGRGDASRLSLLHKLNYDNTEILALEAVENAEQIVLVEAIHILSELKKHEKLLLTLSKDKKAAVREAALAGLIKMDSQQGKELMIETLSGSKFKQAVEAAKCCREDEYALRILSIVKEYHDKLLEPDLEPKTFDKYEENFNDIFDALENKDQELVYEFYIYLFEKSGYFNLIKNKMSYQRDKIPRTILFNLNNNSSKKEIKERELKIYERICTKKNIKVYPELVKMYYNFSRNLYTKKDVYNIFSKYYITGKLDSSVIYGIGDYPGAAAILHLGDSSVCNRIDPDWQKLFEHKKDAFAIAARLDKDNAKSPEGKKNIDMVLTFLAADKKSGSYSFAQRELIHWILGITEEEEHEKIKEKLQYK